MVIWAIVGKKIQKLRPHPFVGLTLLAAISFSASNTGHPQRGQAASPDMAFADLLLGMNSVLWTNYIKYCYRDSPRKNCGICTAIIIHILSKSFWVTLESYLLANFGKKNCFWVLALVFVSSH